MPDWDGNVTKLDRLFLRNVLDNMRWNEAATVRFGLTGQGIKPNYQVTFPGYKPRTFMGLSHGKFIRADEFDQNRISDDIPYRDVLAAYEATKTEKPLGE